jgi:hypothetical protein
MESNRLKVVEAPEEAPVALTRVTPSGFIRWAFWGLRIYIVAMLVLVAIGFSRGLH